MTTKKDHYLNSKLKRLFRIDWAQKQKNSYNQLISVYVGNLNNNITKKELMNIFKEKFKTVTETRVIVD